MSKIPSKRLNSRLAASRRGAVIVEFAFVLPFLLMTVLATIEFGRAMMIANVLTTAAREGARGGVLPTSTNTDVLAGVNSELAANSIPSGGVSIQVKVNDVVQDVSTAETGDRIRVQVTVTYSSVSWLPTPRYLGSKQLTGIAVMRRE